MLNKAISAIFSKAFAHFLSLCHILVIRTIFQTTIIIITIITIIILFVMVISDQWPLMLLL